MDQTYKWSFCSECWEVKVRKFLKSQIFKVQKIQNLMIPKAYDSKVLYSKNPILSFKESLSSRNSISYSYVEYLPIRPSSYV